MSEKLLGNKWVVPVVAAGILMRCPVSLVNIYSDWCQDEMLVQTMELVLAATRTSRMLNAVRDEYLNFPPPPPPLFFAC